MDTYSQCHWLIGKLNRKINMLLLFCLYITYKKKRASTWWHFEGQFENFSEPFEHLFSIQSPHSPLTKQTVVSLKPTITTNSHQMFLLYSGVKTLHQKPSQLFLIQTLCLSVKFISNILFIYPSSFSHKTVFICTGKTKTPKNAQQLRTGCFRSGCLHLCIIHSPFLSLSLCLSTSLLKILTVEEVIRALFVPLASVIKQSVMTAWVFL